MFVAENPSGMPQILSKVFQLYLNKSGDTFRYLEQVIWMPRGFINNQNKNILPTKLQGPGRRKRVKSGLSFNTILCLLCDLVLMGGFRGLDTDDFEAVNKQSGWGRIPL